MANIGKIAIAAHIDNEVRSLFVNMAKKILDEYSIGMSSTYGFEISACIDLIFHSLFYFVKNKQTPGMTIFNLTQNPEKEKNHLILILSYIMFASVLQRMKSTAMIEGWRHSQNVRSSY